MKSFWLNSKENVSVKILMENGINYEALNVMDYQKDLDRIKEENDYVAQDIVELNPDTPQLSAIEAKFDKEHLHTDDEVRFVLSGEGIFDIRSTNDKWIRVEVTKGDYISVPANRNHRFFLTEKKAIQCVRLFKDNSGWAPIYRDTEQVVQS